MHMCLNTRVNNVDGITLMFVPELIVRQILWCIKQSKLEHGLHLEQRIFAATK